MAHYKCMLLEYNAGKDGKTAVTLRITKDRKRKYIKTGLLATTEQWNHKNAVLRDFEADRIDWTLNQFEDAFVGKTSKGKVKDYINKCTKQI